MSCMCDLYIVVSVMDTVLQSEVDWAIGMVLLSRNEIDSNWCQETGMPFSSMPFYMSFMKGIPNQIGGRAYTPS
jgi:hypothetical protein